MQQEIPEHQGTERKLQEDIENVGVNGGTGDSSELRLGSIILPCLLSSILMSALVASAGPRTLHGPEIAREK